MMRARYIGAAFGDWKGLAVKPGAVLDIPEHLHDFARRNSHAFEILDGEHVKRGPGRPKKVRDGDPA